tara:strand:- start:1300 stop:1767 length:468 start_codon:yes stop_codon:yes gene_type:complete
MTQNKFQMQGKVKVINGSILTPENGGLRFVLNTNNLSGKVVGPLYSLFDKKWKKVREETKGWYANKTGAYKLGAVNTTAVQSDVWVIHMLCQGADLLTDVPALTECLKKVAQSAKSEKATVHISQLLVDEIPSLQDLVDKCLVKSGISVSYYKEV